MFIEHGLVTDVVLHALQLLSYLISLVIIPLQRRAPRFRELKELAEGCEIKTG
jgi:hypothetical protein